MKETKKQDPNLPEHSVPSPESVYCEQKQGSFSSLINFLAGNVKPYK